MGFKTDLNKKAGQGSAYKEKKWAPLNLKTDFDWEYWHWN